MEDVKKGLKYKEALEEATDALGLLCTLAMLEGRHWDDAPVETEAWEAEAAFLVAAAAAKAARRAAGAEERANADASVTLPRRTEGKGERPWRAGNTYSVVTWVARGVARRTAD
jgi:hypothetical protein